MEENTQEKNLIKQEEKVSIFGKIKNFFKKIFSKKQVEVIVEEAEGKQANNEFKESIKMTEDEETKLLDLQRRYHRGEIAENDLTDEQIEALCDLYDKQIEEIRSTIKMKEEQIEEYRKTRKQRIEKNNA